jgi:hypothetical protein
MPTVPRTVVKCPNACDYCRIKKIKCRTAPFLGLGFAQLGCASTLSNALILDLTSDMCQVMVGRYARIVWLANPQISLVSPASLDTHLPMLEP